MLTEKSIIYPQSVAADMALEYFLFKSGTCYSKEMERQSTSRPAARFVELSAKRQIFVFA